MMTGVFSLVMDRFKFNKGFQQMNNFSKALATVAMVGTLGAFAAPVQAATTIADFSGVGNARNFRFLNGDGAAGTSSSATFFTTATGTANAVGGANTQFSFYDALLPSFTNLATKFTASGTVTNAPASFDGTTYTQTGLNGSFSFVYSGANTTLDGYNLVSNSTVLFSGTYNNAWIQGSGAEGGLAVVLNNGGNATFSSGIINLASFNPALHSFSINLGNVSPNLGFVGQLGNANPGANALVSFRARAGGAFTASIPEPGTWALMILGFGGAGAMLRRRRSLGAVA